MQVISETTGRPYVRWSNMLGVSCPCQLSRSSTKVCNGKWRTHCCQNARPRRACVRWAPDAPIRRRRSSNGVTAFLLACIVTSAGSCVSSASPIAWPRWQAPQPILGNSMRNTAPIASSAVRWRSLLGGHTMAAASVSPYDSCNITAYREADLGDEDGCFTCVVAWSCTWCYSINGKGRCIDPTEERRFHCSNVAEGNSQSCKGAMLSPVYVVLILLACLLPCTCLTWYYRLAIRRLCDLIKLPVAVPEAHFNPENDPEIPMVEAHRAQAGEEGDWAGQSSSTGGAAVPNVIVVAPGESMQEAHEQQRRLV